MGKKKTGINPGKYQVNKNSSFDTKGKHSAVSNHRVNTGRSSGRR